MNTKNGKPLVIITGASSGIGEATAKIFNESGFPLLLLARRKDKMQQLNLDNAICEELDVTNAKAFAEIINNIATSRKIGCLINNAGVIDAGCFESVDLEKQKHMVDVNLLGAMNGIHAVLPFMQKQKAGTIMNISSLGDRIAWHTTAGYCATKAALKSLTESLRSGNYDKNIRFCNVAPAYIESPIWEPLNSEGYKRLQEKQEIITSEQLADILLWIYQQPQHINIRDIVVSPTSSEI